MRTIFCLFLLFLSGLVPAQSIAITGFSPKCGGFVGTFRADADTTARLLAVSDAGTTATGPWAALQDNIEATLRVGGLSPSAANYRVLLDAEDSTKSWQVTGANPWDLKPVTDETSYAAPISTLDVTTTIPLDPLWRAAFRAALDDVEVGQTTATQTQMEGMINSLVLDAYGRVQAAQAKAAAAQAAANQAYVGQ